MPQACGISLDHAGLCAGKEGGRWRCQASCLCTPSPLLWHSGTGKIPVAEELAGWGGGRCPSWKYPTFPEHASHCPLHPGVPTGQVGHADVCSVPWRRQDRKALLGGQWIHSPQVCFLKAPVWGVVGPALSEVGCGRRTVERVPPPQLSGHRPPSWGGRGC